MALFEGYERRVDKITKVLNTYGIASIEDAKKVVDDVEVEVTLDAAVAHITHVLVD